MKKIMFLLLLAMMITLSGCEKEKQAGENETKQEEDGSSSHLWEEIVKAETQTISGETESGSIETENESKEAENLTLPILDEINENTTVGTAGSSLRAVQSAVKLLDWGTNTDLDPQEIWEATIAWLSNKGNDEQVEFAEKMEAVDDAYQKLLKEGAEELLSAAGCEDTAYPWSDTPVESIEAIMDAVGLR